MENNTNQQGQYKGTCNRTVCNNTNAVFYNHIRLMYYCGSCAYEINKYNIEFRIKHGHELCVKV